MRREGRDEDRKGQEGTGWGKDGRDETTGEEQKGRGRARTEGDGTAEEQSMRRDGVETERDGTGRRQKETERVGTRDGT